MKFKVASSVNVVVLCKLQIWLSWLMQYATVCRSPTTSWMSQSGVNSLAVNSAMHWIHSHVSLCQEVCTLS